MIKIKICQHGTDGFGHQFEGMLRLISLSLNEKVDYMYDLKKTFSFEHSNIELNLLTSYLRKGLEILSNGFTINKITKEYKVVNDDRPIKTILNDDKDYSNTIYCYDGVGCGRFLPSNFEYIDEFKKSLPMLRKAFVLENTFLPTPSYYNNGNYNVVCHIRLGDAVGTRPLDNDNIIHFIKKQQENMNNHIIIHSDGDVDFLKTNNTTICDKNTDVLQILSDFIHADTLLINYSALSIAGHLLADENQLVYCPSFAGPTFYDRILDKCKKISSL